MTDRMERTHAHDTQSAMSATSAECWKPQAMPQSSAAKSADTAKREIEMFGTQQQFSFDKADNIYAPASAATPTARNIIDQMRTVLHKPGQEGDGTKGVEYGGSAGKQLITGDVQQSKVYDHAIEAGSTTNPSFLYELRDLLSKGAIPSDTWHSHPNIKGYDANIFSKEDCEQANVYGVRSYILTPSGEVFMYQGQRARAFQESDRFGQPYGFFKTNGDFVIYKEQRPGEYGPPMPNGVVSRGAGR